MPIYIFNAGSHQIHWWAILAVLISLASALFSVIWNFRSERRSYLDNYWFRQVTAPACVKPVLKMKKKWSKKIEGLAGKCVNLKDYRELVKEFDQDVNLAINKAWVCNLFKSNLFELISKKHERALDIFTLTLGENIDGKEIGRDKAILLVQNLSIYWLGILKDAARTNASSLRI